MANGKICVECYTIIQNASLQCNYCGALQLNFYKKEERKRELSELKDNAHK